MCESINFNVEWHKILTNSYNYPQETVECALEHVRFNFMDLMLGEDILSLDMKSFKEIISSDDLNVDIEDNVFETVKKWFQKQGSDYMVKNIFEHIRYPLLSAKYLLDEVSKFVSSYVIDESLFLEAVRYHMLPNERSTIPDNRKKPRKLFKKLLAVSSFDMPTSSVVELYDPELNTWSLLKNFDFKKRNPGVDIINDKLMIIGGYNGQRSVNSVEIIDLVNGAISNGPSLKEARHNVGVVVLDGFLYAVGGWGVIKILDSVEKYDPVTKDWQFITPMKVKRDCPGVTVLKNKIYVAGGRNGIIYHKSMEIYNPKLNTWKMAASMNQARSYCRIVGTENYIYAIGGYPGPFNINGLNSVERYNSLDDTWTNIASVSAIGIIGVGALGNRIVRAGGANSNNTVEIYDPETRNWKPLAPLVQGREGTVIVEVPRKLYKNTFKWI